MQATTATTEQSPAARLRAELKAAGYNARRVSVRSPRGNLELTVRDAAVDIEHVAGIAKKYERIDRDHATGEILCGGNTFVRVSYGDAAERALAARYAGALLPALVRKDADDDSGTEVPGLDGVLVWGEGHRSIYLTARDDGGYIGGHRSPCCYHDPSNPHQLDATIRTLAKFLARAGVEAAA